MQQCRQKQMRQLQQLEEEQQRSIDPGPRMGCERAPYGNAAYVQDNLNTSKNRDPNAEKFEGAGRVLSKVVAPGAATEGGLNAVGNWIENGLDGEKDGAGWQIARAIPGAVAMGGVMLGGGVIDTITGIGSLFTGD